MNLKAQLNRAIEIVIKAHEGQRDTNNGRSYIEHPFRVMSAGATLQEKIRLQKYLKAYKQHTQ